MTDSENAVVPTIDWSGRRVIIDGEQAIEFCSSGGYPIDPKDKYNFEFLGNLNSKDIYKCRNECDGCEYFSIMYRSDSDAGRAGQSLTYITLKRKGGFIYGYCQ